MKNEWIHYASLVTRAALDIPRCEQTKTGIYPIRRLCEIRIRCYSVNDCNRKLIIRFESICFINPLKFCSELILQKYFLSSFVNVQAIFSIYGIL